MLSSKVRAHHIVREVFAVTTLPGDESIGSEACLHSSKSVFVMTKCMNTTARLQMLVKKQLSKSENIMYSYLFNEVF